MEKNRKKRWNYIPSNYRRTIPPEVWQLKPLESYIPPKPNRKPDESLPSTPFFFQGRAFLNFRGCISKVFVSQSFLQQTSVSHIYVDTNYTVSSVYLFWKVKSPPSYVYFYKCIGFIELRFIINHFQHFQLQSATATIAQSFRFITQSYLLQLCRLHLGLSHVSFCCKVVGSSWDAFLVQATSLLCILTPDNLLYIYILSYISKLFNLFKSPWQAQGCVHRMLSPSKCQERREFQVLSILYISSQAKKNHPTSWREAFLIVWQTSNKWQNAKYTSWKTLYTQNTSTCKKNLMVGESGKSCWCSFPPTQVKIISSHSTPLCFPETPPLTWNVPPKKRHRVEKLNHQNGNFYQHPSPNGNKNMSNL